MNNVRRLKNELIRISNHAAMEKRAFDLSKSIEDAWTGLKNKWDKLDPDTRKNMITALGALGGGAIGYGIGGNLSSALVGFGLAGVGTHTLADSYYGARKPPVEKPKKQSIFREEMNKKWESAMNRSSREDDQIIKDQNRRDFGKLHPGASVWSYSPDNPSDLRRVTP